MVMLGRTSPLDFRAMISQDVNSQAMEAMCQLDDRHELQMAEIRQG